mmetsp:Transcript_6883/g.10637  ORF Transcript_6883/g.10637 Transcript_6883/m.10637 type:complete len:111 (+) Transcript_6883:1235-1567(+)
MRCDFAMSHTPPMAFAKLIAAEPEVRLAWGGTLSGTTAFSMAAGGLRKADIVGDCGGLAGEEVVATAEPEPAPAATASAVPDHGVAPLKGPRGIPGGLAKHQLLGGQPLR